MYVGQPLTSIGSIPKSHRVIETRLNGGKERILKLSELGLADLKVVCEELEKERMSKFQIINKEII